MILLHSTQVFYSQNRECQILNLPNSFRFFKSVRKIKPKYYYDSCFLQFYAANSSRLIRNLHLYIC